MPRKPVTLRAGITLEQAVRLLKNPKFRAAAIAFRDTIWDLIKSGNDQGQRDADKWASAEFERLRFIATWKVSPPVQLEELFDDERTRIDRAIQSGRWGLIPVYPWTMEAEVQAARKRIQQKTAKAHRDAQTLRKAEIALWLADQEDARGRPITRAAIDRVVWGRQKDIRRLTPGQAIARLPERQESAWVRDYRQQGLPEDTIEARVIQRARGSEGRGLAQVRKALGRYTSTMAATKAAIAAPKKCDPIAYAITMAIRALCVSPIQMNEVLDSVKSLADHLLDSD
jgi:hypothetical protein